MSRAAASTPSAAPSGKYLYALTAGAGDRIYGSFGMEGGRVYAVSHGDLSAVVSDLELQRLRPRRRHLKTHHEVLTRLLEGGTVLPMSFGAIVEGLEPVRQLLDQHRAAIHQQLQRVEGAVEMALRIGWDGESVFERLLEREPELRNLRDRLVAGGSQPPRDLVIEVGRRIADLLDREREAVRRRVEGGLEGLFWEVAAADVRSDAEAANLAFLVERGREEEFEQAVHRVAGDFDDRHSFRYSGPWAPHSFVDLELTF